MEGFNRKISNNIKIYNKIVSNNIYNLLYKLNIIYIIDVKQNNNNSHNINNILLYNSYEY